MANEDTNPSQPLQPQADNGALSKTDTSLGMSVERIPDTLKPYHERQELGRTNLGSARWADPVSFAERYRYREGDFWLGRSPITGEMMGYRDDMHVLMASGTRSGKGTSIIINNLCTWQGSIVVLDPKGENASVTAARRGHGSEYCEGLGQDVHVLDPFREAEVNDSFRSRYNPLDAIDMDSMRFNDEALRIVSSIITKPEDGKSKFFDLSAQDMLRGVLLHVKTDPMFEGKRNLKTVRELLSHGEQDSVDLILQQPEEERKKHGFDKIPCPFDLLWQSMALNPDGDGVIAGVGKRIQSVKKDAPETYQGIYQNCLTETMFLDSPAIRDVTDSSDFQLSEIKTNPKGISVYLCLALDDMENYFKWLRIMVTLITSAVVKAKGRPATGHQVLMTLDEFPCLRRMKIIEDSVAQLAGYGLKMFFVVQDLVQLKSIYKDNWEIFVSNSGLKLLFGQNDSKFTAEYISKNLGMTEVARVTRQSGRSTGETIGESESKQTSESQSRTQQRMSGITEGTSEGITHSETIGRSESTSEGTSESHGTSENWGTSKSGGSSSQRGTSRGTGQNHSVGEGSSRSFDTGLFGISEVFQNMPIFRTDNSASSSSNSSRGWSTNFGESENQTRNKGWGRSRGSARSRTFGKTFNKTKGTSYSKGTSVQRGSSYSKTEQTSEGETIQAGKSFTQQTSRSNTTNRSENLNEVLNSRPLIELNEVKEWFAPIDDRESLHYPGYALVLLRNERPTAVRRANYFEDEHFIGWYDPHPNFPENAPPLFLEEKHLDGICFQDIENDHLNDFTWNFRAQIAHVEVLDWQVVRDEEVSIYQFLATIGDFRYDKNKYLEQAFEEIECEEVQHDPTSNSFRWRIYARYSGKISLSKNVDHIGSVLTNQRRLYFEREGLLLEEPTFTFLDFLERVYERASELEMESTRLRERELERERLRLEQEERDKVLETKRQEEERLLQEEALRKDKADREARKKREKILRLTGIALLGMVVVLSVFLIGRAILTHSANSEYASFIDKIERSNRFTDTLWNPSERIELSYNNGTITYPKKYVVGYGSPVIPPEGIVTNKPERYSDIGMPGYREEKRLVPHTGSFMTITAEAIALEQRMSQGTSFRMLYPYLNGELEWRPSEREKSALKHIIDQAIQRYPGDPAEALKLWSQSGNYEFPMLVKENNPQWLELFLLKAYVAYQDKDQNKAYDSYRNRLYELLELQNTINALSEEDYTRYRNERDRIANARVKIPKTEEEFSLSLEYLLKQQTKQKE